jgi:acetyltransferase-like isoleucine patch superfamily enzyme
MKRIIVRDTTPILPFGEPARELRILNKPLWLIQRDMLARYCKGALEVDSLDDVPPATDDELLVYRDNLLFNAELIDTFIAEARATGHACQIAFARDDRAITEHALLLQEHIQLHASEDVYVADLYYYPPGQHQQPRPLVIDTQAYEMGYYHIPSYMAPRGGELVFQVPNRVFLSIENWIHIYIANTPMGVFVEARQVDAQMQRARLRNFLRWTKEDWKALKPKLEVVATTFLEKINPFEEHWRNHFLASKKLVKVGKNCSIDPTAIIHGPTIIGDNVYIGPGVVIANSIIGNNVNIMQGCQIMLSVISDRCFLPFNSAYFMSSLMDNSMVAQNTTLQLCVVGRNTFIGASNCFTDFHLEDAPIKTYHRGKLEEVNMPVLGSAVGHNCKIGSGFVMYPGRMVGSNTTIILNSSRVHLLNKNVNVPGVEPAYNIPGVAGNEDDLEETGDIPRTIYHWPYVRDPETGQFFDPSDPQSEDAEEDQPDERDQHNNRHHPDTSDNHAFVQDQQSINLSESLPSSPHTSRAHAIRIGG